MYVGEEVSKTLLESVKLEDVRENRRRVTTSGDGGGSTGLTVLDLDLGSLGFELPINLREALKYRIRKKRCIVRVIRSLAEIYTQLGGDRETLIPDEQAIASRKRAVANAKRRATDDDGGEVLEGDDYYASARAVSSAWTKMKGANL